jgi:hypothetical protein
MEIFQSLLEVPLVIVTIIEAKVPTETVGDESEERKL